MGRYTAHQNPEVDQVIEQHLAQIVAGILRHLEPRAILLSGSYGRREGSVMLQESGMVFLSDYDVVVVATFSSRDLHTLSRLAWELSRQLGVNISISLLQPKMGQPTSVLMGAARPAMYMYEFYLYELTAGGQVLYGDIDPALGSSIDPTRIPVHSGLRLILNRMIQATQDLPRPLFGSLDRLEMIRRVNKLVSAAATALLIKWNAHHYSYVEQNKRFQVLAAKQSPDSSDMRSWVQRATAFRLKPSLTMYPEETTDLWEKTITLTERTFRRLIQSDLSISFESYLQFPTLFLDHSKVRSHYVRYYQGHMPAVLYHKGTDMITCLRHRLLPAPRYWYSPNTVNQIAFAVLPVLLFGWHDTPNHRRRVMEEARRWLALLGVLPKAAPDLDEEWRNLLNRALWAWWNF